MNNTIYKVVPRNLWTEAETVGVFNGSPVDIADGFIHFSTRQQLADTLAKHFANQHDLLLVAVDAESLGDQFKWEPSRNNELFPHLYGDLPASSAISIDELRLGEDGRHLLPLDA